MIKYNKKYDRWVTDTGIVYRQDKSGAFIVCKQSNSCNGYKQISITKPYQTTIRVHRLVWETFKGPITAGYHIDHEDTHKDNNDVSNLKMCTPKENMNNPLTRKHISESLKGKHLSKIHRQKLGEVHKGNTNRRGKTYSEFGIKFKEHFGITRFENYKLYRKECLWYIRHNKVCRWEVANEDR